MFSYKSIDIRSVKKAVIYAKDVNFINNMNKMNKNKVKNYNIIINKN